MDASKLFNPNLMGNLAVGFLTTRRPGEGFGRGLQLWQQGEPQRREDARRKQMSEMVNSGEMFGNLNATEKKFLAANPQAAQQLFLSQLQQRMAPKGGGMTPYQQAQLEMQQRRLAMEEARFNRPDPNVYQQRAAAGREYGLDGNALQQFALTGQLPGAPEAEKPAKYTDGQRTSAGFARMMNEAASVIDALETPSQDGLPARYDPTQFANRIPTMRGWNSAEHTQYQNAADAWIRAKLRKESGAQISEAEREQEYATYFPMPGDPPEVVAQKRRLRAEATAVLKAQSAGAYDQMFSQQAPAISESTGQRLRYNPATGEFE